MTENYDLSRLSPFDLRQWKAASFTPLAREKRFHTPQRLANVGARAGEIAGKAKDKAKDLPGVEEINKAVSAAMQGFFETLTKSSDRTVSRKRVINLYNKKGYEVKKLADISSLDLANVLAVKPNLDLRYISTALVEGGVAGFLTTGGSFTALAGTAIPGVGNLVGVGAVVATTAADAALVIGMSSRVVSETATYYGFDTQNPDEQLFASGVLGVAFSGKDTVQKQVAMTQLYRLMGDIARRKTVDQIFSGHVVAQALKQVYSKMGTKLTQRKLAQAVPVIGIGMGAGMNAKTLSHVADTANRMYLKRFLIEKYGLEENATDELGDNQLIEQFESVIDEVLDEDTDNPESSENEK